MGRIGPNLLASLFDAHAAALALYARQWCDGPEDIVQEAFIKLARQRPPPDRAVPWLYRVVRNGAIEVSRGDRRRRRRETLASDRESWFASADERIDAEDATRLLAELEPEVREVIVARIWGGLNFDEISRLQGCSLTTAHRRYQAGLSRLCTRGSNKYGPLEDDAEAPLSDLERQLEQWRPLPGPLDRDRMLFDAGRAAAHAESWGRLGGALAASFALVAVGLGGLLVRERGERHALEVTLAERTREPGLPELVLPPPTLAEPAPYSYLALSRRILTSDLDDSPPAASNAPGGEIPGRAEPPLTPLDARRQSGLMDL